MTTAPTDYEIKTDSDAVGIRSSVLFGVVSVQAHLPKNGQNVIWIWANAGQITSGDYFNETFRDAAANYASMDTAPTHWMPWPDNWPNDQVEARDK